jgi:hypothetical protein
MKSVFVPAVLAAVLVGGGLVHGVLTDRWSNTADAELARAVERLDRLPAEFGGWQADGKEWKVAGFQEGLEKVVTGRFTNRLNGQSVAALVQCGHTRLVSRWHTPEQCYPARGYTQATPTTDFEFAVAGHDGPARFHVSDFQPPEGTPLPRVRVFWGWSAKGQWQSPEFTRLAFGRYPVLYKVYVTRQMLAAGEPVETDPAVEFLRAAIPPLNDALFADPRP